MKNVFQVDSITYRYPETTRDVLKCVSLSLESGQVLSILGPNGAGKSTLLNCMAGLYRPQHGEMGLDGKPLFELPLTEVARKIAYVRQAQVPYFSYNIFQFVLMGRAPYVPFFSRPSKEDEEIAWQAIKRIGITHLVDKYYTEISGGERQQCVIARAIAQQPRVIMFDEPTAFLDFGNQVKVLRLIKEMAEEGYAIVMTTHNPDHVLLLDDTVAVLDCDGRLKAGKTADILSESTLSELYGANVRLIHVAEIGRDAAVYGGI